MSGTPQVTITGIRVLAIRLPMEELHRTASGVVSESPLVLTEVYTSTGITGRSIVFTYTPIVLQPVANLVMNMGPLYGAADLGSISFRKTT